MPSIWKNQCDWKILSWWICYKWLNMLIWKGGIFTQQQTYVHKSMHFYYAIFCQVRKRYKSLNTFTVVHLPYGIFPPFPIWFVFNNFYLILAGRLAWAGNIWFCALRAQGAYIANYYFGKVNFSRLSTIHMSSTSLKTAG